MRYTILPAAQAELEREIAYSRKHWGKNHASRYRRNLMRLVREISKKPTLYAVKAELGEGIRCVRYKGNYIIYRFDEDKREIIISGFPSVHKSHNGV